MVSSPPRPEGAASLHYRSQSISGVKEAQSVGGEAGEKLPRETRGRDVAMVEPGARRAERGQLEASGVSGHRRHQRPRSRPSVQPPSSLASDTGPSKEPPPERCVRDGRKAEHEMWRWSAETATVSERSERGDNARQHESRTDGRCQQGSLPGVSDTKNGGGVGDIGVGLEQRCRRTGKAGGKGENVCSEDESANRLFSSTSENASTAGNPAAAAFFAGERKEAPGKVNRREGESVGRNALGSSWGTSATATTGRRRDVDSARGRSTFRHHSSRGVRPLERSRGESLQRSLDGVMEVRAVKRLRLMDDRTRCLRCLALMAVEVVSISCQYDGVWTMRGLYEMLLATSGCSISERLKRLVQTAAKPVGEKLSSDESNKLFMNNTSIGARADKIQTCIERKFCNAVMRCSRYTAKIM